MQLNEVTPYKHKMKIETLICFLVGSLIFTPGLSANPDLPELKFTDYTVENGLSYNSVLSICQDASGKMYFGGTNGIEVFHPDKMPVNTDTVKPAWYSSTATRIIFAILVLGALASLTRWFLKHTETVKAKEIAQITKTYEEKVQKTKLEMFVDSSYNLKSHEETFLSSVLACIEKNIGNQDFTVEALASHACMTRGNLHLKLKNLTGKTPVELIKTMRMKRACELMKETDLSIADIAEQTGFQTPGYFITVFKNHFGETPGHYASRVRQQ